jgi:hypothetical protein
VALFAQRIDLLIQFPQLFIDIFEIGVGHVGFSGVVPAVDRQAIYTARGQE